jgi:hypothetical protein
MSHCLRFENDQFVEANSPLDNSLDGDVAFVRAGYFKQWESQSTDQSKIASASIYQHVDGRGVPSHLISMWGKDSEIALLIADNTSHFLTTMGKIGWVSGYTCDFPDESDFCQN